MTEDRFSINTGLDYESSRFSFGHGSRLRFDDRYRLAQLPLVNPRSSLVIPSKRGSDYFMGIYAHGRCSLVLPVGHDELNRSANFRAMDDAIRREPFASKISWEVIKRRRNRLHATLIGDCDVAEVETYAERLGATLMSVPVRGIRLMGPFLGRFNTGRLYFPVVPESTGTSHWFTYIQQSLGAPISDFFAVGYYNFAEELSVKETSSLASFLDSWRGEVLFETNVSALDFTTTHDDLALSSSRDFRLAC